MCFAPQRRALFRHLNFQKRSENGVFCTFWLRNVLRATTACTFSTSQCPKLVRTWSFFELFHLHFFDISTSKTGPNVKFFLNFFTCKCASRHNGVHFSTSQLPKVVRTWCVLYILTSKYASRHNGVQFFISHLASWLRTRRFSTLWRHKSLEKHSVSRLSYLFRAPGSSFFSDFLFCDLLSSSLLFSAHLCFSSVHIVGSLTSKLPSITIYYPLMRVKQCHKPPMTGNGKHTTYKNGDDRGMVYGIVLPTLIIYKVIKRMHTSN